MLSDYHCDDIPPTAPTEPRTLAQRLAQEIAHLRDELTHANRGRKTMQGTIDILSEQVVEREQEITALRVKLEAVQQIFGVVKPADMRAA